MKLYTEVERAWRVSAVGEIKNIMGRRSLLEYMGCSDREFDTLWTANPEEAIYTQNDLTIAGLDNIRAAFANRDSRLRTGGMELHPLTTPLIEIAEDGKTAQGFWYFLGQHGEQGQPGQWVSGRYCVDFRVEDGQWKIWHLLVGVDVAIEAGASRAAEDSLPCDRLTLPLSEADVTGVSVTRGLYYDTAYNFSSYPALPIPYASFGNGVSNLPVVQN